MGQAGNVIKLVYTDEFINTLCASSGDGNSDYTRHFDHNEDYFLRLNRPYVVHPFPVHHDLDKTKPSKQYLAALRKTISSLTELIPDVFRNLTYFFDPAAIHFPQFYHLYRIGAGSYLYIMRLNLLCRPGIHQIVEGGSNDVTPAYRTNRLSLETDCIPLDDIETLGNKVKQFKIKQLISSTWIGETGRGYLLQGIWMDQDLSKFLSKLFMPNGKNLYPYYPFTCKYRSICYTPDRPTEEGRRKGLSLLHRAVNLLEPKMTEVQKLLKKKKFSEELPLFLQLRKEIPNGWKNLFSNIKVKSYLNEQEMKEYMLDAAE